MNNAADPDKRAAAFAYFAEADRCAKGLSAATMARIALEDNRATVAVASADGVLLHTLRENQIILAARDRNCAKRLLSSCALDKANVACLSDIGLADLFTDDPDKVFACYTFVFASNSPLDLPLVVQTQAGAAQPGSMTVGDLTVRVLDESYLDVICDHYDMAGRDTILRYLRLGWMRGGFDKNGKLVGFIGEHTEGSMGLLHVLSPFRRRGYGAALEAAEISLHLSQGRTPYCQVEVGNNASLALQEKLGLTRLPGTQCWIEIES